MNKQRRQLVIGSTAVALTPLLLGQYPPEPTLDRKLKLWEAVKNKDPDRFTLQRGTCGWYHEQS